MQDKFAAPAADWSPAVREAGFWAAHLMFWGVVFALLLLVQAVYRPDHSEPSAVLAARVVTCLVATSVMRWLSKKPHVLKRLNVTRAGLVAGGLITTAVAITLAFAALSALFSLGAGRPSRERLIADLAINITLVANWAALYFGSQLIRERSSAEF